MKTAKRAIRGFVCSALSAIDFSEVKLKLRISVQESCLWSAEHGQASFHFLDGLARMNSSPGRADLCVNFTILIQDRVPRKEAFAPRTIGGTLSIRMESIRFTIYLYATVRLGRRQKSKSLQVASWAAGIRNWNWALS